MEGIHCLQGNSISTSCREKQLAMVDVLSAWIRCCYNNSLCLQIRVLNRIKLVIVKLIFSWFLDSCCHYSSLSDNTEICIWQRKNRIKKLVYQNSRIIFSDNFYYLILIWYIFFYGSQERPFYWLEPEDVWSGKYDELS